MKKFYIISNSEKDKNFLMAESISDYLRKHGAECWICRNEGRSENAGYHYTDPEKVPKDTECIIVLGGDGTLLQAVRDLVHTKLPFIGINLGTLGFLAEVDRHTVYPALKKILNDNYEIEERMMITGTVYRNNQVIGENIALNDIVIGREGHLRVVRFKNYVNNEYLNAYNADGIIISTPTGSTGYTLSAGGPLVSPSASMLIMTPVAPHTMNTRSIVFPAEDVITVEIGKRHEENEKGLACFDGDTEIPMMTGDRIVIKKASETTRIIKLSHLSFVEVLRQKMHNT